MTANYSDKLLHFPESPRERKENERSRIAAQIEAFLARGGQIEDVGNATAFEFRKRNRQQVIDDMRSSTWMRRNPKPIQR